MGAPQMYYTSCETGLAGYPGFQFNAATPGVGPDVLRRVEQTTSYEPPRSLGYEPTAEQIAACPVNLCYLPGGDGEPAVLARTVFVGNDYSHRFGNYFVHALSLPAAGHELNGTLPIDFWQAGFWSATEARDRELPELHPTPDAPFGPASAEAFLQTDGRLGKVPALLSAIERAIVAGERSVILREADSERVARWVSAVCHLLPSPLARRFSFATYSFRPGRGPEHLVGTVPETEFIADDSALRSFFLLDAVDGLVSEIEVHPLAALLASLGPEDAQTLWSLAEPLATGAERDFTDWYPIAVAGALRADLPVDPDGVVALLRWLPTAAGQLPPRLVADVVERCLDHEALTLPHALALADVAAATRDESLLAAAEIRAFDLLLDDLSTAPARVPRPATERGIGYAREQIGAALSRAAGRPGETLALLAVAVRARLPFSHTELSAFGRDLVGPILLAEPERALPDVLAQTPDLRRGLLDALAAALAGRESEVLAVASRLSEVVSDEELGAYPELSRLVLLARAARRPEKRLPTLLKLTGKGRPEAMVIAALWPHDWTLEEAVEAITGVPDRFWRSEALVARLDPVLGRDESHPDWNAYLKVCEFVEELKLGSQLSADAEARAHGMVRARELIRTSRQLRGSELKSRVRRMFDDIRGSQRPVMQWLAGQVPAPMLRLEPEALAELLPGAPSTVHDGYLRLLGQQLEKRPDATVLTLAATTFEVRTRLARKEPDLADELENVLAGTVARWKSRDLEDLERMLTGSGVKGLATAFGQWRDDRAPKGIGRFLPRRRH